MGDSVLIIKVIIACFGAAAMYLAAGSKYLHEIDDRRFGRLLLLAQASSRLGAFFLFFVLLRLSAQSDVTVYFTDANKVLAGSVPYRDFLTAYGPLFPYVCAGLVSLWNSAKMLVLAATALDIICAWAWWRIGSKLLDHHTARVAAVLYVCSPFVFMNVVVAGQNQVWVAVVLAFATLLQLKGRDVLSGLVYGFALAGIKFLAILFAPVLFVRAKGRLRWLAGFLTLPVLAYAGVLWTAGLSPVTYFTRLAPSSGNMFYVLDAVGIPFNSPVIRQVSTATLMVALIALFLSVVIRHGTLHDCQTTTMLAMIVLVMLAFSIKSHATYLALVFFPICLMIARQTTSRGIWLFGVFNVVICLEPSLYSRFMDFGPIGALWHTSLPGGPSLPMRAAFLVLEIVLLAFYACYLRLGWHLMTGEQSATGLARPSLARISVNGSGLPFRYNETIFPNSSRN